MYVLLLRCHLLLLSDVSVMFAVTNSLMLAIHHPSYHPICITLPIGSVRTSVWDYGMIGTTVMPIHAHKWSVVDLASIILWEIVVFTPLLKKLLFFQRFVPFVAVAAANWVNIPLMRQNEILLGLDVTDENGKIIGKSQLAPVKGISQVVTSR